MAQVAWGISRGFDAKEVGRAAAQQALLKLGTGRPSLAIGFISREFDTGEAVSSISSMLGNTPFWGVHTLAPITKDGEQDRSIIVMLITGKNLEADPHLIFQNQESPLDAGRLFNLKNPSSILVAGDGVSGLSESSNILLKDLNIPIWGCFNSGDFYQGYTNQFAGNQCGPDSIAMLGLGEGFDIGVGIGHGWQDIGFVFQLGKVLGNTIKEIEGLSPINIFERIFGYPAQQWTVPPLSEVIQLYPLGVEVFPGSFDLVLRSPIGIDTEGGLKLNAPVAEGQMAHMMVGDIDACLDATRQAVEVAKSRLSGSRPMLALVLVDYAWHLLFHERIVEVIKLVEGLEKDIPVVGAYTLGQIIHPEPESNIQILNHNIMVLLVSEKI